MAHKSRKGFIQELRRRRVFNTVAIYIVGAWVTLQASDLAFPALGIPESAIRFVWTGAFLLFPLVLIFGWRYDISTGGIKRTAAADLPDQIGATANLTDMDQLREAEAASLTQINTPRLVVRMLTGWQFWYGLRGALIPVASD